MKIYFLTVEVPPPCETTHEIFESELAGHPCGTNVRHQWIRILLTVQN